MKVRVIQTINASTRYRRSINLYYGKPGLATREEVRAWVIAFGASADSDLMYELAQEEPHWFDGDES